MNKNLYKQISNYVPYDEKEALDKEVMLKFISSTEDVLTRENQIAHMTASAWITNKNRDKILMIYHNIYDSWAWTGGHVDGEEDLYEVALREVKEETSVNNLNPISEDIISLEVLSVNGHFKNNQYVSSHLHLNVTYVFVCDEKEKTKIKEDENSGIMWIDVKDLEKYCTEPQMIVIYRKIISSAKRLLEKE